MSNKKNDTARVPQFKLPPWLRPHVSEVRAWGPVDGEDMTCWVEGCERSPHLHGLCRRHYFRAARFWKRPGGQQGLGSASPSETTVPTSGDRTPGDTPGGLFEVVGEAPVARERRKGADQ